ncbi:MAG: hypothetical protein AB4080_05890 [Trichodesmium sp.]
MLNPPVSQETLSKLSAVSYKLLTYYLTYPRGEINLQGELSSYD